MIGILWKDDKQSATKERRKGGCGGGGGGSAQNKDGPRGLDRATTSHDLEDRATSKENLEVFQRWGVRAATQGEWKRGGGLGFRGIFSLSSLLTKNLKTLINSLTCA